MRWSEKPHPKPVKGTDPKGPSETLRGAVVLLEAVVPPATLIAGWVFWFGYALTNTRSAYLGIDPSLLGYSPTDYILRSIDAIFVPAVIFLLITAVTIFAHGVVSSLVKMGRAHRVLRVAAWCALPIGLLFGSLGLWDMYEPFPLPREHYLVPPIWLGGGFALAAYSLSVLWNLSNPGIPVALWVRWVQVTVAALVVISLLWVTAEYAGALGHGRALSFVQNLQNRPAVIVYSKNSLHLEVAETIISPPENPHADYHYRYSGLRLITTSGDKYFLLPEDWTAKQGNVVVLKDRPDLRIEFIPGGREWR